MTRFDADTPADRRKLFADAVTAHRERGSQFLTIEVEPQREALQFGETDEGEASGPRRDAGAEASGETGTEGGTGTEEETGPNGERAANGDGDAGDGGGPPPWIQFAEKTFNLDCTDEELARLHDLLDDYPEFRIDERESPAETQGTNVRISARSDANRLSAFIDRAFVEVYDQSEDYRAWVVQI